MNRRDNRAARCVRCRMHDALCMCALLPRIETQTRLLLVVHRTEWQKPSNTGSLGAACLVNSEVLVRGTSPAKWLPGGLRKPPRNTEPEAPSLDAEKTQIVVLYPAADAISLEQLAPELRADRRPVTLIVPDGNWRQASKVLDPPTTVCEPSLIHMGLRPSKLSRAHSESLKAQTCKSPWSVSSQQW
jgi:DTW domain-containing protein